MMKRVSPLRLIAAASLSGLITSQASALEMHVTLDDSGYFDTSTLDAQDLIGYTTPAMWHISRKCTDRHLWNDTGSPTDNRLGDFDFYVGKNFVAMAESHKTKSGRATVNFLPPPCLHQDEDFAFDGFGERASLTAPAPMAMNATVDMVGSTQTGDAAKIAAELAFAAARQDADGESLAPVPLPMALPPLVFSLAAAGFGFRLLRGKKETV